MRFSAQLVLFFTLLALLSSAPLSLAATQEVVAPRVRVVFEDPALEGYAQRVAVAAERALDTLIPLFGYEPAPITLTLENTTDVYNATASALPRPLVAARALFPTDVSLGYRAEDDLYLLLLHELTHVMQLRYTARPEGAQGGLRLGLVGEGVAALPPGWFVEGLAVWAESEYTRGGRRDDALTTGLVRSAAVSEAWPSLSELSVSSYSAWPGGNARYLYGVGFVDYLVGKYGFDTVLATLRTYNTRGLFTTFADAWAAAGVSLEDEWAAWRGELVETAITPAGETLTGTGWYTRAPAVSPDGTRLAWLEHPSFIVVAELEGGELKNKRTLIRDRFLNDLDWLDDDTLLYVRPVRRAGNTFSEMFALDVSTGRERQLTTGARAALPAAAPNGCVLYVRDDVTTTSQLRRWCAGVQDTETLWTAPAGAHIVGLAVSEGGRVVLSVWRRGFVDLAVLEGDEVTFLTQDAAQDLDPAWRGEGALVFRSDREPGGVFDLYELELSGSRLRRLTRVPGGAFGPEAGADGVFFAALGAGGFDLARVTDGATDPLDEPLPLTAEPLPDAPSVADTPLYPVRPYDPLPSLRPYGWLPDGGGFGLDPFRVAFSASLLGQDDTARHAYALTLGYAGGLDGPLGGVYANLRYDYGGGALVDLSAAPLPFRFGLQVGLWPYAPYGVGLGAEVVPGVKGSVALTLPADTWTGRAGLEAGLLRLGGAWRLDAAARATWSRVYLDAFGYPQRGTRGALTGVWRATPAGPLPGAWVDGVYYRPTDLFGLSGTVELEGRGGYRIAPPVPVRLGEAAAFATAGYRASLPVGLRYGDGLYALERVTVEPRARAWLGTDSGVGADLTLSLDTVLNYSAPLSLSATFGYADGFWTRFGVRLPF